MPYGIKMQKFTTIKSIAAPLDMVNVDTDQIYPKQFLRTIKRQGLGGYAFYDMRFENDGTPKDGFFLDQPEYNSAQIIISGKNFGSGSSREHAVWSLMDFGIRVVIAESFGDIFYNNSLKNGLLPIKLPKNTIELLMNTAKNNELEINLQQKTIKMPNNDVFSFEIDDFRRHCMINGLDDIALTLEKSDLIENFEHNMKQQKPWIKNAT